MQDFKITLKARKSWITMINRIDGIFGCKVLYGKFDTESFNSGRECGEALDPIFNLQYRLESSVVLVEDKSSSLSNHYQARESVITRTPTPLASTPNPSSLPRSCSVSGSCSDTSSILSDVFTDRVVVGHPNPELSENPLLPAPVIPTVASISNTNLTIAMEEAVDDTPAKIDELMEYMPPFKDRDVVDRETILDVKGKIANFEKLLEVSNAEIGRLNAANKGLQAKELELLERQVVAQEAMLALNMNKTQNEAATKRHDALVEAKSKASSILFYVKELDKVVNEISDWKDASDYEVRKAMTNIDHWKEEMFKIIETEREFMILVEKNKFTDDDVKEDRVLTEVGNLKAELDAAILSIENEDNFRALYTLDTTQIRDPVTLPEFSGKDGEDFHVFKEEMERGFINNRTPRADQLSKLRECLSGAALLFVPKSIFMTIDEAWAVLKKSYGDGYRIIKFRKNELMKVGKFPEIKKRNHDSYSQQIAWFLKVENILKGVLHLGKRHPEYSDVAFSFEFISTVIMMFPERLRSKLCDCPGKQGDHLQNVVLKIENLREVAQGLALVVEASTPYLAVASDGGPGHVSRQQGQCSGGRGLDTRDAYKRSRRDKKSRNKLETEKPKSEPSFREIEDTGTAVKAGNQNKIDRKLDEYSEVVEKVDNDTSEAPENEIDNIPEEMVSLHDIYAVEANVNDENELLEESEATEAEVSSVNDHTLPQLDLNASFVKEIQVKHHLENFEDINGTCVDGSKDLSEDDDEGKDVKGQISNISDRESIAKADRETEEELNHKLAPKVLDENENLIAEADDKFKAKLTNQSIKAEAENECNVVKTLFEGTFLENFKDILESINKFVDENEEEDVEGKEIKEKDSKSECSRYQIKPMHDEETLADVKHEPFAVNQDLTMLAVCMIQIILTMLNMLLNVKKSSCASTRFPISEMSSQLMPIIQEKFLTLVSSIKMDLKEDVMEDDIASADNFMVQ